MKKEFKLGDVTVSQEAPPVFFAEIGSYFNGDASLAAAMIGKILDTAERNPDCPVVLKTEILNNPEICLPVVVPVRAHTTSMESAVMFLTAGCTKILPVMPSARWISQ